MMNMGATTLCSLLLLNRGLLLKIDLAQLKHLFQLRVKKMEKKKLFLSSNVHHYIIQRLAFQVRHCGVRCRITYRKQHQQLLVGWPFEEEPELGAAV